MGWQSSLAKELFTDCLLLPPVLPPHRPMTPRPRHLCQGRMEVGVRNHGGCSQNQAKGQLPWQRQRECWVVSSSGVRSC